MIDSLAPTLPLTDCDREPITRLEHIQGFGFLLALSRDWTVVRASENLGALLGIAAGDAIGRPVADLIDADVLHDIRNRIIVLRAHRGSERLYGVRLLGDDRLFDLALHDSADLLVLEGERSGPSEGLDAASLVRTMISRLNTKTTMAALHRDCARQVRALVGFSRVMIYRFDETGAGEVIAESIDAAMQSFEGLHYPATDIPAQARTLYLRNPFRIIADIEAAPVPLLPRDVPTLDLSLAVTRAVSPTHIEYLRNMGVAASLSISIIVEGRLWGLIACHHAAARVPAFAKRSASELFAQMYSMILESRTRQADGERERLARSEVNRLIGAIAGDRRLLHDAGWLQGRLREIIECDGVAVFATGMPLATSGDVPPADALAAIVDAMRAMPATQVFSTERLAERFPRAIGTGARVAGLMSIPTASTADAAILLFRRERAQERTWSGDPRQAEAKDVAARLSPRHSFDAFTVQTRDRSTPFTIEDLRTAEAIRVALVEIVSRIKPVEVLDTDRATDRQQVLIAELNHRVRNILALIRGLINQTDSQGNDVAQYVQSLNGRVQALARAHDQVTRHHWGPGLLATLFEHEVNAYVPTQPERFRLRGPAAYLLPEAFSTMALVIHELFTNSLKYGALSDSGRVDVTVERRVGEGLHLAWRDIDGPPVRMPTRRGFGSAIIERTVPFDLQGTVDVRYLPAGLEVDLFVPERFVWTGDVAPFETAALRLGVEAGSSRPLDGLSVLLLEDNMIVALQTEDLLRELGAGQVHATSTVAGAAAMLERTRIDFAVLDVNVGNTTSLDFALVCVDRAIPFVFASGYGAEMDLGNGYRSVPIVMKPFSIDDVGRAVTAALSLATSGPVSAANPAILH